MCVCVCEREKETARHQPGRAVRTASNCTGGDSWERLPTAGRSLLPHVKRRCKTVDRTVSVPSKSTQASRSELPFGNHSTLPRPQAYYIYTHVKLHTKIRTGFISLPYIFSARDVGDGDSHAVLGNHWAVLCEVRVHVYETILKIEK